MKVITVARKPLSESSVALNVLEHGTGAINVDATRVGTTKQVPVSPRRAAQGAAYDLSQDPGTGTGFDRNIGRWPANLILDASPEVLAGFPVTTSGSLTGQPRGENRIYGSAASTIGTPSFHVGDTGSAARFFKTIPMKPSNEDMP